MWTASGFIATFHGLDSFSDDDVNFLHEKTIKIARMQQFMSHSFWGGFLSFWTGTYLLTYLLSTLKHLPIKSSILPKSIHFYWSAPFSCTYANSDSRGIPVEKSAGFFPIFLSNWFTWLKSWFSHCCVMTTNVTQKGS